MRMKITLNNRQEEFNSETLTISQIMEIKSFHFKMLVVRLNDTLIKREEYSSTQVKNGDDLKIIHLVSGG
ncbi:MAG: thiamine biosynthesis protein ThiS [Bacteroidetes bacterium HGW-Bacteroidetes-5]|nr:MAG: thiamine biosynthesis protein ThiS [Bacteroidetes bacterium HGW-Bacteroidetes-5]